MRKKITLVLVVVMGLTVAACGGKKAVKGDGAGAAVDDRSATAQGVGDGSGAQGQALGADAALAELLRQNKVYFEFDSSAINSDSQQVIEAHAQSLIDNPGVSVVLEGHADERGTREYNLALGERRAKAVADVMTAYGVANSRIQTISYGEERPEVLESNESAWSLNRRVVILK